MQRSGSALLVALACSAALLASPSGEARSPGEKPLPAFGGTTLDNERIVISDYIGRRLLLFFFDPSSAAAVSAARAVRGVAAHRTSHNFEIVGVAMGGTRTDARKLAQDQHLDFPILDDSTGRIRGMFGMRTPVTLIAVDSEGYLTYGSASVDPQEQNEAERVEDELRTALRLPERSRDALAFGERPRAALFEGVRLDGGKPLRLEDHAGHAVVLIFFLHTCPHCHHALQLLAPEIAKIESSKRPSLVAVSILDQPAEVRAMLSELDVKIEHVLLDSGRKLQELYQVRGGVPDIFFLDRDRRIVHRIQGWREKRDPALARMVIAKISGAKVPFLLNPKGYTGTDVCGVCHELELESWHYTQHAKAFDTLVTHGAERNPECVGCHVVGFDAAGGYTIAEAPPHLEDVSCESCHGRGGPHLSQGFVSSGNYEPVCVSCHNPTHSLGFEYPSFRKNVSHLQIAAMTPEQREGLGGSRPAELLPSGIDYVGSEACRGCHPSEYATWQAGPHAKALASLEAKDKSRDAACLTCHTTAFDLPGGFSKGAGPSASPDLARVGCESCHGPGASHVPAEAKKLGTILSLGDKCDSCVILQICGTCHDDQNDPGFAFEVLDKIEKQRHGTIEAGTGKPLPDTAELRGGRPERLAGGVLDGLGD